MKSKVLIKVYGLHSLTISQYRCTGFYEDIVGEMEGRNIYAR